MVRSVPLAAALVALMGCSWDDPPPPLASPSSATTMSVPAPEPPRDPPEAVRLRHRLARAIATFDGPWGSAGERWDPRVIDSLRNTPRHHFLPGVALTAAYADRPRAIGHGATISQPTVVALMTHALKLEGGERVLEIGTGSGYQAAVLSPLVKSVDTIEVVAPLGRSAEKRLARLGYANVTVHVGDGYRGLPDTAPFERIVLTAAPPEVPAALVKQLADGGILVAPVGDGDGVQSLVRLTKRGGKVARETLGVVRFVPMVPEAARPPAP